MILQYDSTEMSLENHDDSEVECPDFKSVKLNEFSEIFSLTNIQFLENSISVDIFKNLFENFNESKSLTESCSKLNGINSNKLSIEDNFNNNEFEINDFYQENMERNEIFYFAECTNELILEKNRLVTDSFDELELVCNSNANNAFNKLNNLNDQVIDEKPPKVTNSNYLISLKEAYLSICQKYSDTTSVKRKEYINENLFPVIEEILNEIIFDPIWKSLIQDILGYLSPINITKFIHAISSKFLKLSTNVSTLGIIVKLIDYIQYKDQFDLISNLLLSTNYFTQLINSAGINIIIKYMLTFKNPLPNPLNNNLYLSIFSNFLELATCNSYYILLTCFDLGIEKQKKVLIDLVLENIYILINNQYGCNILHYIIMLNYLDFSLVLSNIIKNNLSYLSKQPYASKVIMNLFDNSNEETRTLLINVMSNQKILLTLFTDIFGYYVLIKLLQYSNNEIKVYILQLIGPHLVHLQDYTHGYHIYSNLLLFYPELNSFFNWTETKNQNNNNNHCNSYKDHVYSNYDNNNNNNINYINKINYNIEGNCYTT